MLFNYKTAIFDSIYYDEHNRLLVIKFSDLDTDDAYYLVDNSFFMEVIATNLRKKIEFRNLLYWGVKNNYAKRIYDIRESDCELDVYMQ